MKSISLKPGRERALKNRHPWIFSGALSGALSCEAGEVLEVKSAEGEFLALAYFNPATSLTGRVLSFKQGEVEEIVTQHVEQALLLRAQCVESSKTNAYRLINAEGDLLPGIIVDRYNDVLVLQVGTAGAERLKDLVIDILQKKFSPRAIVERSNSSSRKEEGLAPREGVCRGALAPDLTISEAGLHFLINPIESQKTGFFLDQREMRALVEQSAQGRDVLNCFAFSGAFSVYAARGGAKGVATVEISSAALELARRNVALNQDLNPALQQTTHEFISADVFNLLREISPGAHDLIILDPPAFAKSRHHLKDALRGYREINRLAFEKIRPGGLVFSFSCSYHLPTEQFRTALFEAARDSGRDVSVLATHRHGFDHPVSIFHPEGEYLKGLVLYVR